MARLFLLLSMRSLISAVMLVAVLSVPGGLLVVPTLFAQEIATPGTPTPQPSAQATPTIDRLAPPPTVLSPTQADEGAHLFWLHCQPCHGDQGQGLTDEWRMQYPEEEQYCWNSGCHGNMPYEGGFTIPTVVPAVIGENTLSRFATMGDVYDYIRVTMPLSFPGTLTEEEYLAITAFLARAHGVWDGRSLDAAEAHELPLLVPAMQATAVPEAQGNGDAEQGSGSTPAAAHSPLEDAPATAGTTPILGLPVVILIALLLVGGIGLWLRIR